MKNENKPLVSIIIPTYNNADTICRSVDSCINQTYKNIEILVIDDGSTDNTKERLNRYSSDKRFKYIYQENQERSAARNHGLDVARGEYIQFLDSDDTLYPEKLEKQVHFLNKNKNCFLVYCGVEYKNELKKVINTLEPKIEGNIDKKILKGNFITIHSPLFHQTDVRFDLKINRLEDWKFWIYATKSKEIAYMNEILCDVNITNSKQHSKEYIMNMINGTIILYFNLIKDTKKFSNNIILLSYYLLKRMLYKIYFSLLK
jgi:glycosyltransferase involved in cell wall biosynthesis